MAKRFYLAKIGEINLKKGNLKEFERRLAQNFRSYFTEVQPKVRVCAGRMYVEVDEDASGRTEQVLDVLIGITGWAQVKTAEKNTSAIAEAALAEALILKSEGKHSFKIEARRADKKFPLTSYEIAREIGGAIHTAGILTVDVHKPDAVIRVEIREQQAFIYGAEHTGRRGLPCGCSGRALLLLSGGIDSPVAGYKMLFRGMKLDCIYFHSHPYTSEEALQKVETLAGILAKYGLGCYLTTIPFTKVQQRIKATVPEPYLTLMLRMCMMKTADRLAGKINAQCLVTGESLAQVASQTIENLHITDSCTELPVMRPLIGMDKEEIIACAHEIGSYATSILPYEDCCVLFSPKHPVLYTKKHDAEDIYRRMDIEALLNEALEQRETKKIPCRL